ncbi:MAG TPA: ISKra4 family transposase, partial [Solirubrobacteraceae bacterium]|nr:ISKra4 family transposase [Solirubrobacteraceae bacterium]
MQAAEAVLRAGLLKLGGGVLGEALSADPGYRGPRVDCEHGHGAVFAGYRAKVIDTVLGPVTLRRAWYHCARCEHGLAPRDAELGVAGASMSPGLRAMSDKAAAAVPFAPAAGLLADLAGVRLTVKRVERSAEASGAAQAAASRSRAGLIAGHKLVPMPPDPLPDKLYIVIDGTGVPVTSKETAGREGKGEDGRARTREVKMGVFFTQDELDADGYPVRDRASSSYIATFEPAAAFQRLVRAEGIRRGAGHVRQLTVLGDGAAWIWNLAAATFPEATHIVDLYHAREHLHSLTRSLEFMLLDHKDEWLAARLEDLDYGDIDGIEAAVREYPLDGTKKDEAEKELGYFLNNAPRMRYHWFRSRGLFVGSGVVEAGCKSVI